MRTVAHLSDLHFGRTDYRVLGPLREAVLRSAPDLVAISGDLTQRARGREFREARAFLDTLPSPRIVVPGNHDVPLHNVAARFLRPLDKYRRYITDDLEPLHVDGEIAVAGVNTARSLVFKGGRINRLQAERAFARLCVLDPRVVRMIVTHHPFDLPAGHSERDLLGRARMAMEHLARCRADVFLAGHLHLGYITHTAARYSIAGHSALVVQAGTAVSTRGRGEANSFNVLRIEHPRVAVERHRWDEARRKFVAGAPEVFERDEDGWRAI
jgi:3',5'-cyclic AMP phosphodiesterase CpdA